MQRICAISSAGAAADPSRSSEERVYEVVLIQAALVRVREQKMKDTTKRALDLDDKPIELGDFSDVDLLNAAYDRYGTQLMTQERRKAIQAIYGMDMSIYPQTACCYPNVEMWSITIISKTDKIENCAIAVWYRGVDELVDGPNASHITPK